jgi:uncharacterized protein (UPF0332 family)
MLKYEAEIQANLERAADSLAAAVADYGGLVHVSVEDAKRAIVAADGFCQAVRVILTDYDL